VDSASNDENFYESGMVLAFLKIKTLVEDVNMISRSDVK